MKIFIKTGKVILLKGYLLCFVFILFSKSMIAAQQDLNREYDVKAVFLYNFSKFIQWNDDENESFKIGIIGESNIIFPLKEIAGKRTVNNRKIEIIQYKKVSEIKDCNILFIADSIYKQINEILKNIKNPDVLVVAESEGAAKKGAAINFIKTEGKVKFEMNKTSIHNSNLIFSSQLLKLAVFVK